MRTEGKVRLRGVESADRSKGNNQTIRCEIVEVAYVEDAKGSDIDASGRCCDCGVHVCDAHAQHCGTCDEQFCSTCLAFHDLAYHQKKPAAEYRKYRKSA